MANAKLICSLIGLPILAVMTSSCSGGVAPTAAVTISADDVKSGHVFIAKQLLDSIERLPSNQRQAVADLPKNAEALYGAAQTDAGIKQRLSDLGITVKPPVERKRPGHS